MNKLDFYKEVSVESGYDEVLIRVVWNHLWKSIKENFKEEPLIDIDGLGEFHLDMKRTKKFVENDLAEEMLRSLYEKALKDKKLLKLLNYGQNI